MNMNFEKPVAKTEAKQEKKPSLSDKIRKTFMGAAAGVAMMTGVESHAQEKSVHDFDTKKIKTEHVLPVLDSNYTPQEDWHYVPGTDSLMTHETEFPGIHEQYGKTLNGQYSFEGYVDGKESFEDAKHPVAEKQRLEKILADFENQLKEIQDMDTYVNKRISFQSTPEYLESVREKEIKKYQKTINHMNLEMAQGVYHYTRSKEKEIELQKRWQESLDLLKIKTPEELLSILNTDADSLSRSKQTVKNWLSDHYYTPEQIRDQAELKYSRKDATWAKGQTLPEVIESLKKEIENYSEIIKSNAKDTIK